MFRYPSYLVLAILVLLSIAILLGCPPPVEAQSKAKSPSAVQPQVAAKISAQQKEDAKFLNGLRSRRLFDLAESYCQRKLKSEDITPLERATVTIELIKTQTTEALFSPIEQRQPIWQRVDETTKKFLESAPGWTEVPPRSFLVRVQNALAHVARANLLRQELAAELIPRDNKKIALRELRSARTLLDQINRDVVKAIPERRRQTLAFGALSSDELLALSNNILFQQAQCNLIRAQLYENNEPGKLERIDALNQVESQLTSVGRTVTSGPIWWKTKLSQLTCKRLLGDRVATMAILDQLAEKEIPAELEPQLLEERLRLAIADRDRESMQKLYLQVRNRAGIVPPALSLASLETAIALARSAPSVKTREQWMGEASRRTKSIERRLGGYWGRRAELILVGSLGSAIPNNPNGDEGTRPSPVAMSTELDMLVRVANTAYRKQRFSDAVRAFDRAIETAVSQGNVRAVLNLQVQVGQALEALGDHQSASQRMILNAEKFPADKIASAAHLRGCWNLAQVINAQDINSDARKSTVDQFVAALTKHLSTWPNDDSANQAAVWLAGQQYARQEWEPALLNYLRVKSAHRLFPSAIKQATDAADRLLADLDQKGSIGTKRQAIFRRLAEKRSGLNPASEAAIRSRLNELHLRLLYAEQVSNEMFLGVKELAASPLYQNDAMAIKLFEESVGSPDGQAVKSAIKDLQTSLTGNKAGDKNQLNLSFTLSRFFRYLSADMKRMKTKPEAAKVGKLAAWVVAQLVTINDQPSQKDARTTWQLRMVDILSEIGDYPAAIEQLNDLESKFPRKADLKLKSARLQTLAFGKTEPQKPLAKWRSIAARLRTGSESWYEAKLNVAQLLNQSGDRESALKLLKFMQVTPGWKQSSRKLEFDQLFRELNN